MSAVFYDKLETKYYEPMIFGNVELSHTHSKGIDIVDSITPKTSKEQIKDMIDKIEKCSQKLACYNLRHGFSLRKVNYTVLEHEIRNDEHLIAILLKEYSKALRPAKKES